MFLCLRELPVSGEQRAPEQADLLPAPGSTIRSLELAGGYREWNAVTLPHVFWKALGYRGDAG